MALRNKSLLVIATLLSLICVVDAQRRTIPAILAEAGESITYEKSVPSGQAPSMGDILRDADLIVRGRIGDPKSYLSDDQLDVFTDYPIVAPIVLYERDASNAVKPRVGPKITVTLAGGVIKIGNLTYTSIHSTLESLKPRTDCLLILKRAKNGYRIAGDYYGAFEIVDERVTKLTKKSGFAREYDNMPVTRATDRMVEILKSHAK